MKSMVRAWLILCLGVAAMAALSGCNTTAAAGPGNLVVVANQGSSTVSVFGYDSVSGGLTAVTGSPFSAGAAPLAVTIDPQNKVVLTANHGANSISAFTINSDGSLTAASGSPFTSQGNGPSAIAISPDSKFAYVVNGLDSTVSTYTLDSSGKLTAQGVAQPTGSGPIALAMDPKGRFLFTANASGGSVTGFKVDSGSGNLTLIGDTPIGVAGEPLGVAEDPAGNFLFAANFADNVYSFTIDPTTGALTPASNVKGGVGPAGLAVDPGGAFLFSANETSSDLSSFTITSPAGTLSNVGQLAAGGSTPMAVVATSKGKLVYTANSGSGTVSGFSYDTSGKLTAIPNLGFPLGTGGNPTGIATSH